MKLYSNVWHNCLIICAIASLVLGVNCREKKHYSPNNNISLNDLQNIFQTPNCSETNISCFTLRPTDVYNFLLNKVRKDVDQLCIFTTISSEHNHRLNITPVEQLKHLKKLWILPDHPFEGLASRDYQVDVIVENSSLDPLPMLELHINLPIEVEDKTKFSSFIGRLQNLQVLELGSAVTLSEDNTLNDIISSLEGKPLIALSLKRFQSIAFKFAKQYINLTELFWPLRNCPLQYLDLSHNDIISITPGTYLVAKQLRIMDLSHNNLVSSENKGMWIELMRYPSLEILIIDYQGTLTGTNTRSRRDARTLQKYHQHSGNNEGMRQSSPVHSSKSIWSLLKTCMKSLNVTFLQINNKTVFCDILYCIDPDYLSGVPCEVLPAFRDFHFDLSCSYGVEIPILGKNLKQVYAGHLNIPSRTYGVTSSETICMGSNHLELISFNDNLQIGRELYVDHAFKYYRYRGFDFISELNLRNNALNISLNNSMFKSLPSTKRLFLGGNSINIAYDEEACSDNYQLEVLELSSNNLTEAPSLGHCHKLHTLDLSQNKFANLSLKFSNKATLQTLDLSHNLLTVLDQQMRQALKDVLKVGVLKVDLSDNKLVCNCSEDSIATVELIQGSEKYNISFLQRESYTCYYHDSYHELMNNINIKVLKKNCFHPYFYIIAVTATVTSSIIFFIFIMCLCFRYRYRIYTSYFHICRRIHQSGKRKAEQPKVTFDAFISYAAQDRFWVHSVLRQELEKNYGFRICLHYRDFPAHGDIADVIVDHIKKSSSVIVILSENSIRSPWCDFELKSAHAQSVLYKKKFIIIKLGKIPKNMVTSELVEDLLNSKVYIEWPDAPEMQPSKTTKKKQAIFWNKIEKAIYGQSYCECCRFCNPCYTSDDILHQVLINDEDTDN